MISAETFRTNLRSLLTADPTAGFNLVAEWRTETLATGPADAAADFDRSLSMILTAQRATGADGAAWLDKAARKAADAYAGCMARLAARRAAA